MRVRDVPDAAPPPKLHPARNLRSNSPTPTLRARSPALGAPSAVAPPATAAIPEAPLRRPSPGYPRRRLTQPCRSLRPCSQAAILYRKGDVAGLTALAASATDAAERSALEWASLRADAHPSFASLAAFLEAHPGLAKPRLDSRAAGSRTGGASRRRRRRSPHFSPSDPPQSSAGKIAAARAAQATGPRRGGVANHSRLMARRQFRRPDRERRLARIRRFAHQGRPHVSRRPPALRRLPQRWRPRCGARRSRRLGARSGPHRGGSRADEPGTGQGGSAGAAQRSRSPVLQDPVRPARGARLRSGGHAEPRAARSRRARQSGSMVERAEDGRPCAPRPRRAATCVSKSAIRRSGPIRPRLRSTRPFTPAGSPCASSTTRLQPRSASRSRPRPPKIPCPSPAPPIGKGEPPRPSATLRRPRASTRAPPACRSPITGSSPANVSARPVSPCARRRRRPRAIGATRRSARSRRSMPTGSTISRRRSPSTPPGNGATSRSLPPWPRW